MNISAITVTPVPSAVITAVLTLISLFLAAFPHCIERDLLIAPIDRTLSYLSTHGPPSPRRLAYQVALKIPGSTWSRHDAELGISYTLRWQARFAEAISHQRTALKISSEDLSADAETVLWDIEELGWLYQDFGQFQQAETCYKDALKLSIQTLGLRNFHTDRNYSCLSGLCKRQGRFTEAEFYCKQRLQTADSPMIDFALDNLARIYLHQQKLKKAEEILKSPDLVPPWRTHEQSLARLYQMQGRKQEAEATLVQKINERQVTLNFLKLDLAKLYVENGKFNEAEGLLKQFECEFRALPRRSVYPTASTRDLGNLYKIQGRYNEAEKLLKAANIADLKRFDATPLDMAVGYNSLGSLYLQQKRFSNAEILFKKALNLRQHLLYPMHPAIGESFTLLAELYEVQGNQRESERCSKEASMCYKDFPDIF